MAPSFWQIIPQAYDKMSISSKKLYWQGILKINIFRFPILSEYIGLNKVPLYDKIKDISNINFLSR